MDWRSMNPSNPDLHDFPFRTWYKIRSDIGHRLHCYHLYLAELLETNILVLDNMLCHSSYRVFFIRILRTVVTSGSVQVRAVDPYPLKLKSVESREIFVIYMQLNIALWYWFVAIPARTCKICDAILNLGWKVTRKTFLIRAIRTEFLYSKWNVHEALDLTENMSAIAHSVT